MRFFPLQRRPRSRTQTLLPACTIRSARVPPPKPEPIITTSNLFCMGLTPAFARTPCRSPRVFFSYAASWHRRWCQGKKNRTGTDFLGPSPLYRFTPSGGLRLRLLVELVHESRVALHRFLGTN